MNPILKGLQFSMCIMLLVVVTLGFVFLQTDDDEIIVQAFLTQPNPTVKYTQQKIRYAVQTIKSSLSNAPSQGTGERGTVRMLTGNSNSEKIWNYMASMGIAGISDSPEVLAGIMGNLSAESGFNPFVFNGTFYGLYQTNQASYIAEMQEAGLSHLWLSPGQYGPQTLATEEDIDKAIQITLDFMLTKHDRPSNPGGVGHDIFNFSKYLTWPKVKTGEEGAAAYAELFTVTVERCVGSNHGSDFILDEGVLAVRRKLYPGAPNIHYQALIKRRDEAKRFYREYALNMPSEVG